jgi:hypothetical protein
MDAQRQGKITPASAGLAALGLACELLSTGCPSPSGPPPYDPQPLAPHVVRVVADAFGDAKRPARVGVFLQRGILRLTGGSRHVLEGIAKGAAGDPPPRVDVGTDRASVVQAEVGGAPPTGDATFVLYLGVIPLVLSVDTGSGQMQSIDLGGVAVASARVHTETGHIALDWTKPNTLLGGKLELATEAGVLDITHLGLFGGRTVEVKEAGGGFVRLDLGDRVDKEVTIDADVGAGGFIIRAPKALAAHAQVSNPGCDVRVNGWRAEGGGFAVGDASIAPRVIIHVQCASGHVELVTS